ncbi:MAG: flagellar basal body P-ring protein FlgI [Spirochaetota bacterium]
MLPFALFSAEVRLKEIARIEGVRKNQVTGYGIVVGLPGTGDSKSPVTNESMRNYLKNLGISPGENKVATRNIASVLVTANIPSYINQGDQVDITISSIGDAKSLEGGVLLQTPLKSADAKTRVVGSGVISFGGKDLKNRFSSRKANHTVGVIYRGGVVEESSGISLFAKNPNILVRKYKILLHEQDFTTLYRARDAIKKIPTVQSVEVLSPKEIEVSIPSSSDSVKFLSQLEETSIEPGKRARVVINERTGVIVMGADIAVDSVAISKQGLSLVVQENKLIYPHQKQKPVPTIFEIQNASNKVSDIVEALNKIGASTKDIIAILEALKKSGALHAEVFVQ